MEVRGAALTFLVLFQRRR